MDPFAKRASLLGTVGSNPTLSTLDCFVTAL